MHLNTFFAVYTVIYLEQFYTHVYPLEVIHLKNILILWLGFGNFFFMKEKRSRRWVSIMKLEKTLKSLSLYPSKLAV